MLKIALLVAETDTLTDGNYLRFANELNNRDINVTLCLIDSISLHQSDVTVSGFEVITPLKDGDPFPMLRNHSLSDFSHLWVLSLGFRHSFLDKMQLLYSVADKVRIINSLDAIMHLKSKYFLASKPELFKYPESYASTNPDELFEVLGSGDRWIAKPPAGSLGRDVFLLDARDPNARVILEYLCGPDQNQFVLLQAYVPEIGQGEKRVLFAGGKVVGQYLRIATVDHRTNIMQGARSEPCDLTPSEIQYCQELGQFLKAFGAEFVGLDLVFPWIIEFNVINPGGLLTILELTGQDLSATIISEIGFIKPGS
jgi:glutathione synthase